MPSACKGRLRNPLDCPRYLISVLLAAPVTAAALGPAAARADDATRGGELFEQCSACHSNEAGVNKLGPSLFGIVGRKAGTEPGFSYSDVMARLDRVWTKAALDAYLAEPSANIPGTKMVFAGIKDPAQRADLIAYLATLQ